MDDTRAAARTGRASGIGTTALGRIQMRVREDDGFQEVMVERRWPDMTWVERTIGRLAADATVLEIQVFEESWQHARSWETTKSHPVAEVLQLGVPGPDGLVRWAEPRSMSPRAGSRHLI
jgi:hypothetical protein